MTFLLLAAVLAAAPEAASSPTPPAQEALARRTLADWCAQSRATLATLGVYGFRLVASERVEGKLQDEQQIDFTVRESPLAAYLQYVKGPGAGRKVLFDSSVDARQLRVRDHGLVGFFGAFWLDIDGKLARSNTAHGIRESGFGASLTLLENETARALPFGGLNTSESSADGQGNWCLTLLAPRGTTGLYAQTIRACFRLQQPLPTFLEVSDAQGLKERYRFEAVKANALPAGTFYAPKDVGL